VLLPRELVAVRGVLLVTPINKLAVSLDLRSKLVLICKEDSDSSLACKATMVVDMKLLKSGCYYSADRVVHIQPWPGRWVVFLSSPWFILTERRPFLYVQAMEPKGRPCFFFSVSMAWCYGSCAAPSDTVPGGGEVVIQRKKTWT